MLRLIDIEIMLRFIDIDFISKFCKRHDSDKYCVGVSSLIKDGNNCRNVMGFMGFGNCNSCRWYKLDKISNEVRRYK